MEMDPTRRTKAKTKQFTILTILAIGNQTEHWTLNIFELEIESKQIKCVLKRFIHVSMQP